MRIVLRPDRRPGVSAIVPSLLVGEYPTSGDVEWLHTTHGVTAVVNLQDHADLASKGLLLDELISAYRKRGIRFHHVPIADGDTAALRMHLQSLVELMQKLVAEGACIYLHCNGGYNRAPTVAIAYLHVALKMPLDAAVELMKRQRPCVPFVTLLKAHYGRRSRYNAAKR